jgi:ApbE superfamily uncharacterized protein (UPF0280 family)
VRTRHYRSFRHKDACFRICTEPLDAVAAEIIAQRRALESYVADYPEFRSALAPVPMRAHAPEIARRMHRAADRAGVGPMAAVAGAFSQMAAEAALASGAEEAIVENGGDIYASSPEELVVALHASEVSVLADALALRISPREMPVAVCSSSSFMGHSLSFGACDLATVVADDASVADAMATAACNRVRGPGDIDAALEWTVSIAAVRGALIVVGEAVGMVGRLPELVRNRDLATADKTTRFRR